MVIDQVRFLVLCILCMINTFLFASGEVRCIQREREALLSFKQGLIDDYSILSSWGSEQDMKECCNWKGVLCSNITSHVIGLELSATHVKYLSPTNRLRGTIRPSLLELDHLISLDLSNNDFGFNKIPAFIGSMRMLQRLILYSSNFSGIIPYQLGNLTQLNTLDLSLNILLLENFNWLSHLPSLSALNLSGAIINDTNWVQAISKFPALKELDLYGCQLTDVTLPPDSIANLSSLPLFRLNLMYNSLTSSSFNWLFNISSLGEINLMGNDLDGLIPDAFGKLTFLEMIDLSYNMLEGGIPESFGNLSHLKYFNVVKNNLTQPVAKLFGNLCCKAMTSLVAVDLSYNPLTGSLPDLSPFLALTNLSLSGNRLIGSLPLSYAQLTQLQALDVSFNSLEGTISKANFMGLHNLRLLDLSDNNLTLQISPNWNPPFHLDELRFRSCKMGPHFPIWLKTQHNLSILDISNAGISDEAPSWLWSLSGSIHYLNMSHNQISGIIPNSSSKIANVIDLSSNDFSGPIPLFNPNISIVQLSQNRFSGSISSICPNFMYGYWVFLDISDNKFEGVIPNCWEKIPFMSILNLANNNFQGAIPQSLGSLRFLTTLHLHNNHLSGELPVDLKNCKNLQLIDVGGNNLSGNFPQWIGANYAYMTYIIFRENRFHGNIPKEICNLTNIQLLDLSRNNISGKIPDCFDRFTLLVQKNGSSSSSLSIPFFGPLDLDNFYVFQGDYSDYASVQWKGQELEYKKTLGFLKLIDLSSNTLIGSIPRQLFSLKGLISLNLSSNNLTGNIDPNIGQMERLESLDLSRNQLFGVIPIGLAQLSYLQVLNLSNNSLSGKIPTGAQLQSFDKSVYAGNAQLCGPPLLPCPGDGVNPSTTNEGDQGDRDGKRNFFMNLSIVQEFGISMAFGFIFGFWGIIGPLFLKRSWRIAYFKFFGHTGDWFYLKTSIFLAKRSRS